MSAQRFDGLGVSDSRDSRPMKEGQVLWTIPYREGDPEPQMWNRWCQSKVCGPKGPWPRYEPLGCGVTIYYENEAAPPTECALCGSQALRDYAGRASMGIGPRPDPDGHFYEFRIWYFESRRTVLGRVIARRKALRAVGDDIHVGALTMAARGLVRSFARRK